MEILQWPQLTKIAIIQCPQDPKFPKNSKDAVPRYTWPALLHFARQPTNYSVYAPRILTPNVPALWAGGGDWINYATL